MQVQCRVVRARLWLPSILDDGFIAVIRDQRRHSASRGEGDVATSQERLCYGTQERERGHDTHRVPESHDGHLLRRKCWCWRTIKWAEPRTDRLMVALAESESEITLRVVIFTLATPTESSPSSVPQISLVASAAVPLNVQDLGAIEDSQEVVFSALLANGMGEVEMSVRSWDNTKSRAQHPSGREDADTTTGGGFSVHWTSSEALEKDLQRNAQRLVLEECKLLKRLRSIEKTASRVQALQQEGVIHLRARRAARTIQRAYRQLLMARREQAKRARRQRREEESRQQREREANDLASKRALRAKVVERNQVRTCQLIRKWTERQQITHSPQPSQSSPESLDMNAWIQSQETATRQRLLDTLTRLKEKREQMLTGLMEKEKKQHSARASRWAGNTACREKEERVADEGGGGKSSHIVPRDLVDAIRLLHIRK